LFQPQYKPVQKWQKVLQGTNPALKKKAVVAIGRQLIVDLWRLQTGRVTLPKNSTSMKLGLCPKPPVWGEQFNGQPLWGLVKDCRRREPRKTKRL
jgi:hypothetical protein